MEDSPYLAETLGRLESKIDRMGEAVHGHGPQLAAHEKRLDGLEGAVSGLERHRWKMAGAAALVGGVTAAAGVAAAIAAVVY